MAGEGTNEFIAKITLEASQFKAELDSIVAKMQVMGGEVKNYTAGMGNDFQTGFANIISSSSELGQILGTFAEIAANAQGTSSEMQQSFNTAFAGIQTDSESLRTYLQTVFDSVAKIQGQMAILDPLKNKSAKQPGKAAAIAAIEEELKALMALVPGADASSTSMQGFIDMMAKVGTQGADVGQSLTLMTQVIGGMKDKLRETTEAAGQTAESLKNLSTTPVRATQTQTATTTTPLVTAGPNEDDTAKLQAYRAAAVQAVTALAAVGATANAQMQSIMSNTTSTLQQKAQQINQIIRNLAQQTSTMNVGTKVNFSNITNAANPVKIAAVQAQAAVTTATTNINAMIKNTSATSMQKIQAAGDSVHSYFANLGKRIVNTLTSIVISFLVYRLGRSILDFGKQCVEAFTQANASAMEFQNTLTSRGMDPAMAINVTNLVDSLAISTGFIRNDLNQAMTQMVIRFGEGKIATKAFEVALDNARAKGMPLQTSMQQVSIAALGSLKALRQFGIQTNKDLQGNMLTPMQNLVNMAERVKGGMETFISTPLGQLERAKAAIDEFKTALGSVLIGVVGPFAQFFTFVLKGIADMIFGTEEVGSAVVITKEKTVAAIRAAIDWASKLLEIIGLVAIAIGAIQIAMLNPMGIATAAAGVAAMAGAIKGKSYLLDQLDKFSKSTSDPFKDYTKGIADINGMMDGLHGLGDEADTVANSGAASAAKFIAAWEPLKLLSGNLPELSKFVGSLASGFASGFVITRKTESKSTMKVDVHFDMSAIPSRQRGTPASQPELIAKGKAALDANPNKNALDAAVDQISKGVVAKLKENITPRNYGTAFPSFGGTPFTQFDGG